MEQRTIAILFMHVEQRDDSRVLIAGGRLTSDLVCAVVMVVVAAEPRNKSKSLDVPGSRSCTSTGREEETTAGALRRVPVAQAFSAECRRAN